MLNIVKILILLPTLTLSANEQVKEEKEVKGDVYLKHEILNEMLISGNDCRKPFDIQHHKLQTDRDCIRKKIEKNQEKANVAILQKVNYESFNSKYCKMKTTRLTYQCSTFDHTVPELTQFKIEVPEQINPIDCLRYHEQLQYTDEKNNRHNLIRNQQNVITYMEKGISNIEEYDILPSEVSCYGERVMLPSGNYINQILVFKQVTLWIQERSLEVSSETRQVMDSYADKKLDCTLSIGATTYKCGNNEEVYIATDLRLRTFPIIALIGSM